jgi:hypothetical protein
MGNKFFCFLVVPAVEEAPIPFQIKNSHYTRGDDIRTTNFNVVYSTHINEIIIVYSPDETQEDSSIEWSCKI